MEYSSSGKGTAALTTGIIGTVGTGLLLANGGLGNGLGLFGNNDNMLNKNYASKDDLAMAITLSQKDSEIALLKSEQNTEIKIADVYERIMTRVNQDQRDQAAWNASQSVANAQMTAAISTNNASIASLQACCNAITKTVVPITSVCPQPMPQYNSWTAPTTTTE